MFMGPNPSPDRCGRAAWSLANNASRGVGSAPTHGKPFANLVVRTAHATHVGFRPEADINPIVLATRATQERWPGKSMWCNELRNAKAVMVVRFRSPQLQRAPQEFNVAGDRPVPARAHTTAGASRKQYDAIEAFNRTG
jgi:hypothetical protein